MRGSKALAAAIGPGLALTTAIAVVAFAARELPGLSLFNPMVLGLAIGIAWRNVAGLPLRFATGLVFSQRTILRVAIVLLGLQITAADIVGVGATGLAIVVVTLVVTFVVTVRLGALMKIDSGLAELLAAGTSICGASAIVAVNTITRARDEYVAYAVACITVCGSVAIFLFPAVSSLAHLTDRAYGLWAGSSIHEIAQVVAAAYQDGPIAGAFATLVKLTRILMLGPMVMVLGLFAARRAASASTGSRQVARFPWFIAGFLALAALNSVASLPASAMDAIRLLTTFFLTVALSAFGLGVNVGLIRSTGTKPFLLCVLASLFIAGLSLGLIALTS